VSIVTQKNERLYPSMRKYKNEWREECAVSPVAPKMGRLIRSVRFILILLGCLVN
jgi:hypothetical protein